MGYDKVSRSSTINSHSRYEKKKAKEVLHCSNVNFLYNFIIKYKKNLQNKIEIIALSKADLIRQDYKDLKTIVKNKTGKVPFIFSNLTKNGIDDLIKALFDRCNK